MPTNGDGNDHNLIWLSIPFFLFFFNKIHTKNPSGTFIHLKCSRLNPIGIPNLCILCQLHPHIYSPLPIYIGWAKFSLSNKFTSHTCRLHYIQSPLIKTFPQAKLHKLLLPWLLYSVLASFFSLCSSRSRRSNPVFLELDNILPLDNF